MNFDDIKFSSVNWEHGMLLTPEHFRRHERYFDSAILWVLRYATDAFGLVGGGPRLPETERGAVRHDPIVVLNEDESTLLVSVTQCRGLTPSGCIVDIAPEHAIERRFAKTELEGVTECGVFIVCQPHEKRTIDGAVDEFNPQMQTERVPEYRLTLQPGAEHSVYALAVARLRKSRYGTAFEKDPNYIPLCTTMVSHSELTSAWRRLTEEMAALADRYAELHRAMREFLLLFTERGIETELDAEVVGFVDRMVVAAQNCAYEILDPTQRPERFFGVLERFFRSAAVYLDLSPETQRYFEVLKQTGESEFITLVEQQKKAMQTTRRWNVNEDLGVEVRSALQSLSALRRLERALEGKYIDFRLSASLEAMNFIFDRGGRVLYKLAAKPSRVQGFADEMAMHFAGLRLEGRDKYRLVLVGQQDAVYEKGSRINVEIRINEGSGFRRSPILGHCEAVLAEQRNFEFDFEAPDVPTITDLRVVLPGHEPVHTALLFVRHRFYATSVDEKSGGAAGLRPDRERVSREPEPYVRAAVGPESETPRSGRPSAAEAHRPGEPPPWESSRRPPSSFEPERGPGRQVYPPLTEPPRRTRDDEAPPGASGGSNEPPWDSSRRSPLPEPPRRRIQEPGTPWEPSGRDKEDEPPPPPPRRRRLEP